MKIYVTRHGETEWNVLNKVCGLTDVELTENGIAQAKALADKVQDLNVGIVISSPLKRAYETGRMIAEKCSIPITTDPRLIEQNYGIYEGVDRKDPDFLANKRNFAYKYPGGESMMQLAYRVYGFLDEIKEKYSGENVLIVSHGGICRVINTYFKDMTNDEYFHHALPNCELMEYDI